MTEPATTAPATLVVVPTYNEAAGIEVLLDRVLAADPHLRILVVDDSSPDGTAELVRRRAAGEPRIELLVRSAKQGLGRAYVAGFRQGLEGTFERFVEMDADLSHDPDDLPRLIRATEHADLVIGSRYLRGGRVEGWSRRRHLLSFAANTYARTLLGFGVRDSTSGFRCYRRGALETLDLDAIASQGYAFQVEMAFRIHRAGLRVTELPITFRERSSGRSKMSRHIVIEGMLWVTRTGLGNLVERLRRQAGKGNGS